MYLVRKLLNRIEYKTSRVEALSASKSKLIQGSIVARKELLSLAQSKKEFGSTQDPEKDKLSLDTATQILYFLQLDILLTPRDGIREDNIEPFIYKDELQSITQGTRSKLQILNEMVTLIVSVEEEESKIKNELGEIILRGEKEHGPLEVRLAMLEDEYKILTDLKLELINIMENGNIKTLEKGSRARSSTGSPLIKRKSRGRESESSTDRPSTIQPMQDSPMLADRSIKHSFIADQAIPEPSSQTKPKENISNRKADEKSNSLGEVAWERIFHESKLPHTEFMDHL